MKILPMETDIKRKRHLLSKQIALIYCPIATTLTAFVAHASRVRGVTFHENPSNGSRYKEEKAVSLQAQCPYLLTDRNHTECVCNARVQSALC